MTQEKGRKKRSEKLSDAFAARMARGLETSERLDTVASGERAAGETRRKARDEAAAAKLAKANVASMQPVHRHGFTRCPHCREYVPWRDSCRACGAEMS